MSTTGVFVGLLCGRKFAIASIAANNYKFKSVFPISWQRLSKNDDWAWRKCGYSFKHSLSI